MSAQNVMSGFPPSQDRLATLENWRTAPFNTWSFQHVRELIPTAPVPCDPGTFRMLESGRRVPLEFGYNHGDEPMTLVRMIEYTSADGFLALHGNTIVAEEYRNGMTSSTQHILFSVTKSVTSMLAGVLQRRGSLDVEALISAYVPEIDGTAYEDASVRNLLDMTVGVGFDEDYTATEGLIVEYRNASGWNPGHGFDPSVNTRSFMTKLAERDGAHGAQFKYVSPNSDLLGWVIERASGTRFVDLLSDAIWKPMGAAHEAYMAIDHTGCPRAAGGLCATLRDMGRLALLLFNGGMRGSDEIIPSRWIDDIQRNGNRAQWNAGDFATEYRDWPLRYRSKCYILGEHPSAFMGIGIHGQFIFMDPERDFAAVQFSSQPDAVSVDKELAFIRACCALSSALSP